MYKLVIKMEDFMKKKDIFVILGILVAALAIYLGYSVYKNNTTKEDDRQMGYVYYQNTIILAFDVNRDKIYDFDGSYGHMQLEVLDGKWRITNEECPNHICSSMGWVGVEDLIPIVCIPNEIYVEYGASE